MKQMNRALMVAMIAGSCSMVSASAWALDPAPCASDADCGEGVACESGYCAVEQPLPSSECEADADCASGYTCQVVGASGCAPSPDGLPQEPCVSEEFRACVPPPPAQCDPARLSVDCSGGDVCVTYTFETCSGGEIPVCACAEGTDCECDAPEPQPGECQSEAVSYCVPPYLAPCSVDLDCGAGFTCEQQEICTASCADGPPREPGADGDEPIDCESSCAPSGQTYCQLVERPCDADADCGAGFVCETFSYPSPGVPDTCAVDEDGNELCSPDDSPVEPPPADSYCMPEGWERWGAAGGGSVDPDSPIASNQDGDLVGAESARPARQDGSGFPASDDASADGGGCQVGGASGAAGSGLSLLALIAGVFGLRRRRD